MSQVTEVARMSESNNWLVMQWHNLKHFYRDVRQEMKRVTWPTRNEVSTTTMVVVIAVFFFGFFLWIVDVVLTYGFDKLTKWLQ